MGGGGGRAGTYLVFDERGEGEEIEEIGEVPPHVGVAVLAQALVVEPVHLSNLSALVVPAEDGHAVAIAQLQRDEQGNGLH